LPGAATIGRNFGHDLVAMGAPPGGGHRESHCNSVASPAVNYMHTES
jgi:hypothetical protein